MHTSSMRILIATGLYPPDIGGPATYTKFLERHLPQHGIEYDVVSFSHVRKYPRGIRHLVYLWRLLQKGRKADGIYALDTVSVGLPAMLASFVLRKKFFLRVPGDYAWEQGQQRFGITDTLDTFLAKKEKPIMVKMLAWLQTRVALRATRVVVPSEYMKTVVASWGVTSENVVRIYSALNPIVIGESRDALRTRYGYSGFTIITAARLTPWKGIEALITVTTKLRGLHNDMTLEIVGDGEERDHLTSHIEKLHAGEYVHMRGQVTKKELAERIKAADVFVLNTSYEGLSHQLLEVMEIGIPIITTPVGGNSELIQHEKEGLLVPWNDVEKITEMIVRVQEGGPDIQTMCNTARNKVGLFTEEIIISDIIKLFENSETCR